LINYFIVTHVVSLRLTDADIAIAGLDLNDAFRRLQVVKTLRIMVAYDHLYG